MLLILLLPVFLTVALGLGLWWWTPLYDRRPTIRLLATLITTSVLIVGLQLLLGIFRSLTPAVLGAATFSLIVALHAGYGFWGRRFLAGKADPVAPPTKIGMGLGIVVVAVYGWIAWVGSLVPPWAWDTLTYHLTAVFHVARSRGLEVFTILPGGGAHFFFPQVAELHASWFYLLSGASEASYRVPGYGLMWLTLTAAVATRAAVEALGLRVALPWIVPAVMLTPGLASQPIELYVDSTFAAFLLAAFAFGIWADRESRFAHLVFTALASGLAFGVKVSFLYFFLPIAAVLISHRVWRALVHGGFNRALARTALLLLLFVSGFGFWLGRNLVRTGNPFWPTRIELRGVTIFEGPFAIPHGGEARYVSSSAEWLVYWFRETYQGKPAYSGSNGFGPLFAAGYVSVAVTLPLAFARRQWRLVRALSAIPLTGVMFLTVHPTSMPRYIFAVIGFAAIGLAIMMEIIGYGWSGAMAEERPQVLPNRRPLTVATVALSVAIAFSALGCTVSVADELGRVIPRWRAGTWKPQDYYQLKYGSAGNAFNWITDNGGPDVTFTPTNATFIAPLFGWHNRNRVVHAALPGDPHLAAGRRVSGYAEWRRFLHDERVNYIVVWVPWWGETTGRASEFWIEEHPDDFALVEDFGRARIYRPVFSSRGLLASTLPTLNRLGEAESWKLEYRKGADTSSSVSGNGVRFDYSFNTPNNDYSDWRARIPCDDWSPAATLSFDIEAEQQPAYLIIYLKNYDPSESCRFRVDLRNLSGPRGRIRIPLRAPEWRSDRFDLKNICEVHVVLDDVDDTTAPRGSVALANFGLDSPNRSGGGVR